MEKLVINLNDQSYPIYIGAGLLKELGNLLKSVNGDTGKAFVITDTTVEKLYADIVIESLNSAGWDTAFGVIPAGEKHKNLDTARMIYDKLIGHGMDRGSVVVSLGGGVVGDLAGFVAATYMRGVPFVQVPTTLLAQVDSSIGGKVAVNHPAGKNLIGAFYQPLLVLIDPATLKTLPEVEFAAGMAEVIKHGMILDNKYFSWLEENSEEISNRNMEVITRMIYGSCFIKGKVVEADVRERNLRAILNFGHTIGHALEALTDYRRYRHGEAVAIGMVQAAKFALDSGLIDEQVLLRLKNLLTVFDLPCDLPEDIDPEDILRVMKNDKKVSKGNIRLILPCAIGTVKIVEEWNERDLLKILKKA